jgi:DNA-directed RNA polymerase specialized sigma24 family protein
MMDRGPREPQSLESSDAEFGTTNWAELRELAAGDPDRRRQAIDRLTRRYWPAVYAHLRGHGQAPERAAAVAQDFFADVVLERDLFAKADARRGRLRSYLLAALRNYQVDLHRRAALRHAAAAVHADLLTREESRLAQMGAAPPCDDWFERRWALGIVEEALRRCAAHYRQTGRHAHWVIFEDRVLAPAVTGNDPPPLDAAARRLGFRSAALGAAAVQVVRERLASLVREVIAETIEPGDDVEVELAEIRRLLG